MCKKITLISAVVVLLIGVQSLIAQERDADRPRGDELRTPARVVERQPVVPDQQERPERSRIQQRDRDRFERGDQPMPEPPIVMESRRRPAPPVAPAKTGPVQEEFGKWLDELTKAYRANDREKMGEIIRQMHQFRQRWQKPAKVFGQDSSQVPKKVEKLRPSPEKKMPAPAEKQPPGVWEGWQGRFPGRAGWGVCPWCGRCPRCGAMVGRRMGMNPAMRGGFGRGQPYMSQPPVSPDLPEDVVRPMLTEPPRGPARRGLPPIAPMNPALRRAEPLPGPTEPEED